jgi:hypothetical protein
MNHSYVRSTPHVLYDHHITVPLTPLRNGLSVTDISNNNEHIQHRENKRLWSTETKPSAPSCGHQTASRRAETSVVVPSPPMQILKSPSQYIATVKIDVILSRSGQRNNIYFIEETRR